jgi:hypothetical protein
VEKVVSGELIDAVRWVTALWDDHEPDAVIRPVRLGWNSENRRVFVSAWHAGGRFYREITGFPVHEPNLDVLVDSTALSNALFKIEGNQAVGLVATAEHLEIRTLDQEWTVDYVVDTRELPEWATASTTEQHSFHVQPDHVVRMLGQTRPWGVRSRPTPLFMAVSPNNRLVVWRGHGDNSVWAMNEEDHNPGHITHHVPIAAGMAQFLGENFTRKISPARWRFLCSIDPDGHETGRGRIVVSTPEDVVWIPATFQPTKLTPWPRNRGTRLATVHGSDLLKHLPEVTSADSRYVEAIFVPGTEESPPSLILNSTEDARSVSIKPLQRGSSLPDGPFTTTLNLALIERVAKGGGPLDLMRYDSGIVARCGVLSVRVAFWADSGK